MDLFKSISNQFWLTKIWLPPNTTWVDIAPELRTDIRYTDYRDLIWPLPLAIIMLFLKHVIEKNWIAPIGKSLNLKSTRPKKPTPNEKLEKVYQKKNRLTHEMVAGLAKQNDMKERQIERWWRLRRAQNKPTMLEKFCENSWRCLYYLISFTYGIIILLDKPWFWDIRYCWYEYPHQSISNDVWWYYMISMSFYWALTFSQFSDVKRKDFWQMFVHHAVTLLLMALSWVCNLHRVGSLVLVIHNGADINLKVAKIMKYGNIEKHAKQIYLQNLAYSKN